MLEVGVVKHFSKFDLQVEFSASDGITALFGRSGAGKTTIANMIAGLVRPDLGIIKIQGRTLFDHRQGVMQPPEQRRVGYVFQDARLFPHKNVRENLLYGRQLRRKFTDAIDYDDVIGLLGIEPLLTRAVNQLSGGERQRVAIGRALLSRPEILIMDEPLAALDGGRRAEIIPYIERLRDRFELPILYISHSIQEVTRLADTLVLLDAGAVVAAGSPRELLTRLDLRPITGRYQAGALVIGRVDEQLTHAGLTRVRFGANSLLLPLIDQPIGTELRLRVLARDVAIALEPVHRVSIQNQVPARIASMTIEDGPFAELRLDVGGTFLLARITAHSARQLRLRERMEVTALIKSIAIERSGAG